MSGTGERDSKGRKQPSKFLRKKRAVHAAKHRWKHKQVLIPGHPRPWSERSYASKLRHLAAARKGGATTGSKIREQQRMFWDFYHGNSKAKLRGPFTIVVETFERIEAAYLQRYGERGLKSMEWEGFFAEFLYSFVFTASWTKKPEHLEGEMWELYETFMEAGEEELWGMGGLMTRLLAYEEALEQKKRRIEMWRLKNPEAYASISKKSV